jgi:hypothetical protein
MVEPMRPDFFANLFGVRGVEVNDLDP